MGAPLILLTPLISANGIEELSSARARLTAGLQRVDFLENNLKPLFQLFLGSRLSLCFRKARIIFKRSLIESGSLHQ